jgi:hypothetical protein
MTRTSERGGGERGGGWGGVRLSKEQNSLPNTHGDAEPARGRPNLKPPPSPPGNGPGISSSSSSGNVRGESVSASPCTKPQPWGMLPPTHPGGSDVWVGQEEDLSVYTENITVVVRTRPLNEAELARSSDDPVLQMCC